MAEPTPAAYTFGSYRLLPAKRTLLRNDRPVVLTPKGFDTLLTLVQHRDRVVTKDELLREVWAEVVVEEGNLTQQIFLLRKALEDSADGQQYIATVPRVGYRFVADVTTLQVPDSGRVRGARARLWSVVAAVVALAAATVGVARFVAQRNRGNASAPHLITFTQLTADRGMESFSSVSPDGQFFVYVQGPIDYAGESDIYIRRVGSDRGVNLTPNSPGADTQPAVSPDGLQIAFRSERSGGGIFRMRITGESVQRVTDTGYNPSWSPDCKRIAYSTISTAASPGYRAGPFGEVWIVDVASGARTRVAQADAVQPHWSPHGHRIAYWRSGVETRAIYTVSSAGGEPTLVAGSQATRPGEFIWNPVWSPDGGFLYFISNRSGSMNVWRVPIDEASGTAIGPPEPITLPTTFAAHLSFSARGDRLLFASLPTRASIHRIAFDPEAGRVQGDPIVITKDSRQWVWPEPSPDGRFLAFHSGGDARPEDIYVSAADGSDVQQLTDDPPADRVARWSPDGRRIAFYSMRSGHWNIWMVNADGSSLRQVTYFRDARLPHFPAWSPDGRRMSVNLAGGEAFIFDPAASWDERSLQFLAPIPGGHFTPWSWSPDGRAIAGWYGGGGSIAIYELATRTYESITTFGSTPVWLNDNRRVIFAFQNRLFIVDRATKSPTELISLGEGRVQMAAGGGFSVTRDGRAIYATPVIRDGDIWMATMR